MVFYVENAIRILDSFVFGVCLLCGVFTFVF